MGTPQKRLIVRFTFIEYAHKQSPCLTRNTMRRRKLLPTPLRREMETSSRPARRPRRASWTSSSRSTSTNGGNRGPRRRKSSRRPVSPTPLRTTRREQPTSQLRWKRKKKRKRKRRRKKRRRKRRKNKCFLTFLLRPSDSPSNLLHLKSSITSTSTTTTTAHPKQQKTISFHESFVKAKDLVSNRLETLETSRQLLQLHRFLTSKKTLLCVSQISPPQNSFLFRLFHSYSAFSL